MARAKNAILNAVGDNSENFVADMQKMIDSDELKNFMDNESDQESESLKNNDTIPLDIDTSAADKEKERNEDIQVLYQKIENKLVNAKHYKVAGVIKCGQVNIWVHFFF